MNKLPSSGPLYAVVATVRALLLVELRSKRVTPLEWDQPEYYGISWRPEGKDLILSHSMLDNNELRDVSSYAMSEVGILSEGVFTTSPFLSQPHQIVFASDQRIICTNTGRNSISIFDPEKPNFMQEGRVSSARWDRLSADNIPGDHLNSVFEKNSILYAIAHRHGKGSALATFSYPDLDLLALDSVKNRSGLHNIWITGDGQRISCHSEAGSLIDLSTGAVLWDAGSPVYTRGLAASADFVLVGESERSQRTSRRHSMSGLWLLDRKSWQAVDYFCLGSYGAVHEVRLLNVKDEAHHGHTFAGLDTLLTRDRRDVMTTERLQASQRARQSKAMWHSFDLIFGSPLSVENSGRAAGPQDLCLLIQRSEDHANRKLNFLYSIDNPEGEAHVAIVSYRGEGSDTDMDALLVQRQSGTEAAMSLWTHDGRSWARRADAAVAGLPLSGEIGLEVADNRIKLEINGQPFSGDCLDAFTARSGILGIRWLGSTIWPGKAVASPLIADAVLAHISTDSGGDSP
ncbi:hypothetical protein [Caballeronia sp. SBC2]|uniref:hypothetical protein n=1 Tax=Caballeronia sp. SBC2 TaxID=2705547 RepID=UPI0013E1B38A|nr:hypothetical protein [Caballeronia sp. SBC2]QIE24854.1 hypothetical protein SBC2_29040 [Caballeronia sp. SBC2]